MKVSHVVLLFSICNMFPSVIYLTEQRNMLIKGVKKMVKKKDLRVKRTKTSLNRALLKLMEKKHLTDITIQELANEAMVNRVTFYLHYDDIYNLLDQCVKDNLDAIMLKHVTPVRHIKQGIVYTDVFYEIVTDILQSVEDNERFFQIIFQSNYDKLIKDYFIRLVKENFIPQLGGVFYKIPSEWQISIMVELVVSAILGVMSWWVTSEKRESPEEIAEIVVGIVTKGPAYVLGLKTDIH